MDIKKEIKDYITKNIMSQYINNNYGGHGWDHIKDVINRSFELADKFNLDVNPNMVYVVAAYHDLGYKQDPDNHEQVSSDMFMEDEEMKNFFTDEERQIIADAIVDHRASLEYEARSVYGKLVSSADRAIDVDQMLKRSIAFQADKHKDENPTIDEVIEYSFKKLSSKYGNGGYAKMYFPDDKYNDYLEKMNKLFTDKSEFINAELDLIYDDPNLQEYFKNKLDSMSDEELIQSKQNISNDKIEILLKDFEEKLNSFKSRDELCNYLASKGMHIIDEQTGIEYYNGVDEDLENIEKQKEKFKQIVNDISEVDNCYIYVDMVAPDFEGGKVVYNHMDNEMFSTHYRYWNPFHDYLTLVRTEEKEKFEGYHTIINVDVNYKIIKSGIQKGINCDIRDGFVNIDSSLKEFRDNKDLKAYAAVVSKYINYLKQLPTEEAAQKARQSLIDSGVLNENGEYSIIDKNDEKFRGFLRGFGIKEEDIDSWIEESNKKAEIFNNRIQNIRTK